MDVERGRAPVEGTHLLYEAAGDGPWMVLAHGGEGTHLHWWQQVAAFRREYRCVTYDARGFGASPPGDVPESGTVARDDLLGLMEYLSIDRAVLVGHSMGGIAVSGVAQAHPARVRGLVMSDTPFGFATAALAEWAAQMMDKITAGFEVMDHLFAPGFSERRPDLFYLYGGLSRLNDRPRGPRGLDAYEAWRRQPPADYSAWSVPTLFLVGTEDDMTVPSLMRATATAVGGAQLVEIDGAGHSGYGERADVFNDAVLRFCRTLR